MRLSGIAPIKTMPNPISNTVKQTLSHSVCPLEKIIGLLIGLLILVPEKAQ